MNILNDHRAKRVYLERKKKQRMSKLRTEIEVLKKIADNGYGKGTIDHGTHTRFNEKASLCTKTQPTLSGLRQLRSILLEGLQRRSVFQALPLLPELSRRLNDDIADHIFSFLNDETLYCIVPQVSHSFRNLLASCSSRQKHLALAGFKSLNESKLESIVHFFPHLESIDFSGCENIILEDVADFVWRMGPRLKHLRVRHFGEYILIGDSKYGWELFTTMIRNAPSLASLSLEINGGFTYAINEDDFLVGHRTLRELSFIMEARYAETKLPRYMPNLEVLKLEILDAVPSMYWNRLLNTDYPRLKRLEVTIINYALPQMQLGMELFAAVLRKFSTLESVSICRKKRPFSMDNARQNFRKMVQIEAKLTSSDLLDMDMGVMQELGYLKSLSFAPRKLHISYDPTLLPCHKQTIYS